MDYQLATDDELIACIRAGDDVAMGTLLKKYNPMVKREARTMFLVGGDTEDLIQEGMIGLFGAISDYDPKKGASFSTFARLCVERRIIKAIAASKSQKNIPLNNALSFDSTEDEEGISLYEKLESELISDPEELVIAREATSELITGIRAKLSKMENIVLDYYLDGLNYTEIAAIMGKQPKAIDNAIQRIRKKAIV
ncbi:MAG: sigma-70 family RNA polymerase sigma factor [Lachnospiraceae bacterium]|nr:sigma-70 family RNA polymerase sigma factor [Lachnospiraceae bacterium]